jgi:hypothetical protein
MVFYVVVNIICGVYRRTRSELCCFIQLLIVYVVFLDGLEVSFIVVVNVISCVYRRSRSQLWFFI